MHGAVSGGAAARPVLWKDSDAANVPREEGEPRAAAPAAECGTMWAQALKTQGDVGRCSLLLCACTRASPGLVPSAGKEPAWAMLGERLSAGMTENGV